MLRADTLVFKTPKGEMHRIKTPDGEMQLEIRWNPRFGPELSDAFNNSQEYIDSKVLEYCAPYVPKDQNTLIQSGILCTQIGSGEVKYRTPYARRWYYMPARFQNGSGKGMGTVGRGNYWFERMKRERKKEILTGAKKVAGAK